MNLRPFVNDKVLWKDFLEELDQRIANAHKSLEQATDPVLIHRYQGRIEELRNLKMLREKVNNG